MTILETLIDTTSELAELRKDKARLDWLERNVVPANMCGPGHIFWRVLDHEKGSLREAIDKAMASEQV